jgi:hypothetical protein
MIKRMTSRWLAVGLVLVAACFTVLVFLAVHGAPLSEEMREESAQAGGSAVRGRTVDAATGEPAGDVKILLSCFQTALDVRSDADGAFCFQNLKPRGVTLRTEHPRWVMVGHRLTVQVREGETAYVEIQMQRGGVVTGRVTDADTGEGIEGVEVKATSRWGDEYDRDGVSTDGEGRYRIDGLIEYIYWIHIVDDRDGIYISDVMHAPFKRRVELRATPGKTQEANFQLKKLAYAPLSGIVVDQSGQPVAGVPVSVDKGIAGVGVSGVDPRDSVESSQDGSFEIRLPHPEVERVYIQARQRGFKSDRLRVEDIPAEGVHDLVLTVLPSGSISGVVLNAAREPAPNIKVELWNVATRGISNIPPDIMTDDAGRFRFDDVLPSDYVLVALGQRELLQRMMMSTPHLPRDIARMADESPHNPRMARLTVGPGEHVDEVVLMHPDVGKLSISGRIVDGRAEPIKSARVQASGPMEQSERAYDWPIRNQVDTDALGHFEIDGLLEGTYSVHAGSWWHEVIAPIEVVAGTEDLEVVLRQCPVIEGRVVHAVTGEPVRRFKAFVRSPSKRGPYPEFSDRTRYDEHGRFRIQTERREGAFFLYLYVVAPRFEAKEMPLDMQVGEIRSDITVRLEPSVGVK